MVEKGEPASWKLVMPLESDSSMARVMGPEHEALVAAGRGLRQAPGLAQGDERPQVHGQPSHGRLGNLPGGVVGRPCAQGSVSPAAEHGVDPSWDRPGPSGVVHCKSL